MSGPTRKPRTPQGIPDQLLGVGWVGGGRMGQAMVERLLDAGVAVSVWNRTAAKLRPLVQRGAWAAKTPAAAADCGVVFSMVLDDEALGSLWQADDGVLSGQSCRVWIDCSTVSLAAAAAAGAAARKAGVEFASAPVSGNPVAVRAGTAIFAVSGTIGAIEAAVPYLERIGRATHVVGVGNQATVVKLCTNAALAVLIQALTEVVVLGEKCGVRRSDLMNFINDSAIGSTFTRSKSAALVKLDLEPTFTPEGQRKDIRLALDLGQHTETPMPLVSGTEVAFSRLIASGLGDGLDYAALILQTARDAGVAIEPESPRPLPTDLQEPE